MKSEAIMSKVRDDARIVRGMERQLNLRRERLGLGEKPLGWKVGFGASAALERLDIDGPLVGFLTDKSLLSSGTTASIGGWANAVVEPEIAVYLGSDLAAGADRETARAAISAVGPAIELADVHFPPNDVETILAGNIYHRHVILGQADSSRAGCVLDGLVGHVFHNGEAVAEVTDSQAVTGDLIDIVRHVADVLAASGERLRAGEVVITGSIISPLAVAAQDEFRFELEPLDTISINIQR
jgi:2-keto-4-pentenoate hydratase